MNPQKQSQSGFTLLEVLLALAIFSIMALATVKEIDLIRNTKNAAMAQIDSYNGLRSTISIIRNDVQQGFHVLYDDLGEEMKSAILQSIDVPHSLFDGRKKELVLTTLSHRVYYKNKRETEQTEISFFLQAKKGGKYPSLMKRESELIDGTLFQGGKTFTLLDNVTNLEFSYWDDKAERWIDDWNSDGGATRDKFPKSIRIKLAVWDEKSKKELKTETGLKIAFPNNDPQLVQF